MPCVAFATIDGLLITIGLSPLDDNLSLQNQTPVLLVWDLFDGSEISRIPLIDANVYHMSQTGLIHKEASDSTWSLGLTVTKLSIAADGASLAALTEVSSHYLMNGHCYMIGVHLTLSAGWVASD